MMRAARAFAAPGTSNPRRSLSFARNTFPVLKLKVFPTTGEADSARLQYTY